MLLPSKELKELHNRVPICLSGEELPGACDVRFGQFFYFFVFDKQGELTTVVDFSRGLTERTKLGEPLPTAFVGMIEDALVVESSLDSVERAYLTSKGSKASYEVLANKLEELNRIGAMRVVRLLRENAKKMNEPTLTSLRALQIEIDAVAHQVIDREAIEAVRGSIESFVTDHPAYPGTDDLLGPLLTVGFRYSFDVGAHCQTLANGWRRQAKEGGPHAEARRALAKRLIERSDAHLRAVRSDLAKQKDGGYAAPRLLAQLGEAKKLLPLLDARKPVPVMRPVFGAWRAAAQAKLKN